MAFVTYPLNNIEYSAQDAELFHVTRTSGIYAKDSFDATVNGSDKTVVIGTGIGWIKNGEFSGKVIAQKEAVSIDLDLPDSVYPRIDAIVIQFDANNNATDIVVKTGTASSNPIAPPVVRTESVYELHLYHVRRNPGVSYVTSSDITDLRLDSTYCGLMADSITTVDTDKIEEQISVLIKSLENAISDVENGSAYLQRDGSTPMTGPLNMDNNKILNLPNPEVNSDAVNLSYLLKALSKYLNINGSVSMTGSLNMGGNKVTNLLSPTANSDAVNLEYVKKLEKAYITDIGTSGIWTYRKWSNGIKECWGTYSTQSYAVTSEAIPGSSGFVYGSTGVSAAYPSGMFTSAPRCQYSMSRLYSDGTVYSAWLYSKKAGTSAKTTSVAVARIGSAVTATLEIYFYAVGT